MKRLCALILALVMAAAVLPTVPAQAAPGTVKVGSFQAVDLSQYGSVNRYSDGTWAADTGSGEMALLDEEFRPLFTVEAESMEYISPGRYCVDTNGISPYGAGLVDRQGKQIIPCQYNEFTWYAESSCYCATGQSGSVVFNADGTVRFRCGIDSDTFTYDSKTVCNYKGAGGLVGIKDLNGNVVLKATYDNAGVYDDFGRFIVEKNGVWGTVDKNGKVLIPLEFDMLMSAEQESSLYPVQVKKDDAWGLYLSDGRKLLDCVYTGRCWLDRNERDGTVVFETEYGDGTAFHFDPDTWACVRVVEPGENYISDGRYIEVDSDGLYWLTDESGRRLTSRGYMIMTKLGLLEGQCGYLEVRHNESKGQAIGVLDIMSGKEVVPLSTDLFDVKHDDVVAGRLLLQGTGKWGRGHWGSYDPAAGRMVYDYEYVEFRGGLVQNANRNWGLIDRYTGEVKIPCEYTSLKYSDEGVYIATRRYPSILTEEGEVLFPPLYPDVRMITGELFAVEDGVGNWALCDKDGNLLTPQTYDSLRKFHDYDYILASKGLGEGLLTMDGEVVIPVADNQTLSIQGDDWLVVCARGRCYAIDLNGLIADDTVEPDVVGSSVILGRFRGYRLPEGYTVFDIDGAEGAEGMTLVRYSGQFGEKYGFADRTGRIVIPCEYDSANNFHEGLALVEKLGQYGYIDTTGKVVIPLIYDAASDFSQGYAAVANGTKVGYIDRQGQPLRLAKTGEEIQIDGSAMDFDANGFAAVRGLRTDGSSVPAVIDTKGNVVVKVKDSFDCVRSVNGSRFILRSSYDWDRLIDNYGNSLYIGEYRVGAVNNDVGWAHNRLEFTEDGLAPAQSYTTKLWGFVDLNGVLVIDQVYSTVQPFTDGLAKVGKTVDGTKYWGIIDIYGREVVPVEKAASAVLSNGLMFYRNTGSTYGVLTDKTGKAVYTNYKIVNAYSDDFGGCFEYTDQRGVVCKAWLDTDGKIVGTMEKNISYNMTRLSSELFRTQSSKGYGVVNAYGVEMIPMGCNYLYPMEGGGFVALRDGVSYILTEMGAAVSFVDLEGSESYLEAIEFVVSRGLMNGISATELDPDGNLNRAAMVTMLWRLAGKPKGEYKGTFSDVAKGTYYAVPAEWGNANGIVLGYPNGAFGHADVVTREQAATFLYRYVQSCGKGYGAKWSYTLTHTDADQIHAYALEAISWCVQNGVYETEADGTLNPRGVASRVETASMFYHVYDLLNG